VEDDLGTQAGVGSVLAFSVAERTKDHPPRLSRRTGVPLNPIAARMAATRPPHRRRRAVATGVAPTSVATPRFPRKAGKSCLVSDIVGGC
jgi:hypothetical protein